MDRINLEKIALAGLILSTVVLVSACPLADPLELRTLVEERVAAAGTPGTPDTGAPVGSVIIAGASAYTNSVTVSLSLSASDTGGGSVTEMLIGNDPSFSAMSWEPYVITRTWSVTAGENLKTVYARFKDGSGNISPIFSDTITLDQTAPTIVARPAANNSANVVRSQTSLSYTFSEAMNTSTLNASTVKLEAAPGSGSVTVTISKPDPTHVALGLGSPGFYFGHSYTLKLLAGITDLAGNPLAADTVAFSVENDFYENTGAAGAPTGNGHPNNPFFLFTSEVDFPHVTAGRLNTQEYDGHLARTQSIGGFSDQDRYSLYIDCAQSNSITIHVFATDSAGNPSGSLAAGQGIKFVLYNPASSPVLISSGDYNLLKNDQTGTWNIPYGTSSDYYTLVIYGDDSGRYYDFTWSEDYNGI